MNRELSRRFFRRVFLGNAHFAAALLLASSTLIPAAHAQFEGRPGAVISGAVFDANGNQPIARARVKVRAMAGGEIANTLTDAQGRFEAANPNGIAGSYIVSVDLPGYQPAEEQVDGRGGLSDVVLTLKRAKPAGENYSISSPDSYTVSVNDLQVPGKARKTFDKGLERLQTQDAAGSIAYFKEATNAFPNYYEAFYQLGVANMELRRRDEAERALQKAIDLSGGRNPDPQFALGAILCDRGAYADAEKLIRLAMETDSSSWRGHLFLSEAQFGQNQLADAEKSARAALSRKPDLAPAYILLANIHIRERDYKDAVSELDNYLRLKPDGAVSEQARKVRAATQRVMTRFAEMYSAPQFFY